MSKYHIPVMLQECMEGLSITPNRDYVDATFGGGGHSAEILSRLKKGRLFAFDQDVDAAGNVFNDDRFFFIMHNFRFLQNFLKYYNVEQVDGILADLGVSSHDFDIASRGFSFRFDGDLDMRMNQKASTTAADIINKYTEQGLKLIFQNYGEVKNSITLAKQIVKERANKKITTTGQLKNAISPCIPRGMENKYLAQVYQALRIEVNQEMEALKEFLLASLEVLNPGGRLVIMTYHSLEDRMVKNFLKSGNLEGKVEKDFYGKTSSPFKLINRKVIVPTENELKENPRSRSAKLRVAEKI